VVVLLAGWIVAIVRDVRPLATRDDAEPLCGFSPRETGTSPVKQPAEPPKRGRIKRNPKRMILTKERGPDAAGARLSSGD